MSPFEALPYTSFVNVKSAAFPVHLQKEKPLKWSEARRSAVRRDGCCRMCSSGELLTVHHFWPRGLGGGNELANLVTLCEKCHQNICSTCSREKTARVPGWAHSEHRIKPLKIHTSLREIFDTPADQFMREITPGIPGMDLGIPVSRRLALPWDFRKGALPAQIPEQREDFV